MLNFEQQRGGARTALCSTEYLGECVLPTATSLAKPGVAAA